MHATVFAFKSCFRTSDADATRQLLIKPAADPCATADVAAIAIAIAIE